LSPPPPTHPPFRVWLSWGSSSRCPNQSSVCIVLSDVVELAELAEMAELLLCCCGDEVIYSILSRFFLLCVCVLNLPCLYPEFFYFFLSSCVMCGIFCFLLLLVCNFVLFLLFCRCRLSVLSFTSTSHFYPSGSFYPGSLFRTFLPVFLLFSPFRLFWRPFGALYGLALRKSEKREWDIRVTIRWAPPPIFIIILLFVGSEVTRGGQSGGLFWYFIFVNLTHQVTLMAVPLIRLLTIRSAEKLSITVVQV
jgi:hypothetical protein